MRNVSNIYRACEVGKLSGGWYRNLAAQTECTDNMKGKNKQMEDRNQIREEKRASIGPSVETLMNAVKNKGIDEETINSKNSGKYSEGTSST